MTRFVRLSFRSLLLAAALLLIASAPAVANTENFQRTVALPSGGSFVLSNVNGSIRVEAWDKELVEIRAVKTARHGMFDLGRVQILVEEVPEGIAVRTVYPQDEGVEVSVEFHVRVPRRVLLRRVETVNGSVTVRGVEGAGLLRSVNGNVDLLDGAGRFEAHTTNGNVYLELHRLDPGSPISIETVNGSVVLALPTDASAELAVRSMNGDFRSELPLVVRGSSASREFRGQLGGGGDEIRLRAVNGGIRVVATRSSV